MISNNEQTFLFYIIVKFDRKLRISYFNLNFVNFIPKLEI